MPLEFFATIEQVSVSGEFPAHMAIAKGSGNVYHLGVEIPDPLHLIVDVEFRRLYHPGHFDDDIGVDPFALKFGDNGEDDPGEVLASPTHLQPDELQFLQKAKSAVEMFEILV